MADPRRFCRYPIKHPTAAKAYRMISKRFANQRPSEKHIFLFFKRPIIWAEKLIKTQTEFAVEILFHRTAFRFAVPYFYPATCGQLLPSAP